MKEGMVIAAVGCVVALAAGLTACGKSAPSAGNGTAPAKAPVPVPSPNANPTPTPPVVPGPTAKFEGEIFLDVKDVRSPNLPLAVTFDIKGDRVSYQPIHQLVRAIDDVAAQRAYLVSDAKRSYMEVDTRPSASAPANVRIERSTKQETVAGLRCQDWTIDDGVERAEVCAAQGIAFFDPAASPIAGAAEPSWARALTSQKAFPLRLVVRDHAGREQYRAEAFEVSWRKVDDATLAVPGGFQKSSIPPDLRMASLP